MDKSHVQHMKNLLQMHLRSIETSNQTSSNRFILSYRSSLVFEVEKYSQPEIVWLCLFINVYKTWNSFRDI